jgi:hypothetical protein
MDGVVYFIPTRIYIAKNSVAIIPIINKLENEIFANQFILGISNHIIIFLYIVFYCTINLMCG